MEGSYKEEDSVRLSCQSKGRPMPVISWYKDSVILDSGADPVPDIGMVSFYLLPVKGVRFCKIISRGGFFRVFDLFLG